MKHRVKAYITLPIEAVFEDDTVHSLVDQSQEALKYEAEGQYCLNPEEFDPTCLSIKSFEEIRGDASPRVVFEFP